MVSFIKHPLPGEELMIYHMVAVDFWNRLSGDEPYESQKFGGEGFIHTAGSPEQLLRVANNLYKADPDPYLILCIDEAQVDSEIRHELVEEDTFPHIYGLLNREAVVDVIPFPRGEDGSFLMPDELAR
jgi:uncharacterized protein (DUF952 family)